MILLMILIFYNLNFHEHMSFVGRFLKIARFAKCNLPTFNDII